MKKFISILIVLSVSISSVQAQGLGYNTLPRPVNVDDTAIDFVQDMRIMTGSEDGEFHPDSKLTRCELVKVALLSGKVTLLSSASSQQSFTDIQASNWCYLYAATAKANNILSGYPDGTFKPNQAVTQIEALKILLNTLRVQLPTQIDTSYFKDVKASDWWAPYVQYAVRNGLVLPELHNNLQLAYGVDEPILRKETAFIIWNLLTQVLPRRAPGNSVTISNHGEQIGSEDVRIFGQYTDTTISTFQILHYCVGKSVSTSIGNKKSCIGKNSLIIKTSDNLYLLLDERDTTTSTFLPVLLGDPIGSDIENNIFIGIAYPLELCAAKDGKCKITADQSAHDFVNFLYFPRTKMFQKVAHFPSPARIGASDHETLSMVWNNDSTKAIFLPQSCLAACKASPIMGYDRVTDEVKPLTSNKGLDQDPDLYGAGNTITSWWTDLRWGYQRQWTARFNTKGKESVTVQITF